MIEQTILTDLEKAAQIVRSWPRWKQDILINSSKSTNSSSRLPVVNQPPQPPRADNIK